MRRIKSEKVNIKIKKHHNTKARKVSWMLFYKRGARGVTLFKYL